MANGSSDEKDAVAEKRPREEVVFDDAAEEPLAKMAKTDDAGSAEDGGVNAVKTEDEESTGGGDDDKEENDPSSQEEAADEDGNAEDGDAKAVKTEEEEATSEVAAPPDETKDDPENNTPPSPETKDEPVKAVETEEVVKGEKEQVVEEGGEKEEPSSNTATTSTDVNAAVNPSTSSSLPNGLPPGLPDAGQQTTTILTSAPALALAVDVATDPEAIVEEKDEVSSLYVGRVIGKGGEMIRDLQARSGCKIDVDQNVPPGQPRLITYRGTRKTVDFAKRLVYMLCQENVSEADLPLGEAKREFLVVPASSVGKIIGRGGEMIRELQNKSHAKIQVDHTGNSGVDPNSKQVTITGTDLSVAKAKEMVLFLVANPMMDAMQSITMLIQDKTQGGGVWGSGPPYPNLPQNGQNMQPGSAGYGYDQSYYGGGASAPTGQYAAPSVVGAYGAAAAPAYQPPAVTTYGGGMESEMFYASKSFMGRIIGSKGVTINDLQRRSGCDIQINQDVPPGRDCEITIRGTRQGIEMTKQMLRDIIEIGPNHPYAGGQGGQSYGAYQQSAYGMQQQSYGFQGGYDQQQPYGQQTYGQPAYTAGAPYQAMPQTAYGAPSISAPPVSEWKAASAPDGQVYYYNERTGETTWQKPPGMP